MTRVMNSLQMSAGGGEEGMVDSEPTSGCSLGPRAGLGSTGSEYSGTNSEEVVTFAEPKKEESNLEKEQIVKEQTANNYQVIVPGPI